MIKFGVIGSGWIAEEFVKGAKLVAMLRPSILQVRIHFSMPRAN